MPAPDYATLRRDANMAAAYDATIRRRLATITVEDDDAGTRLERLRIATTQAASKLPVAAQAGGHWSTYARGSCTRTASDA